MMGGRAAEELVFHDPTTGASNDIEKATSVARAMVTQYGMTERLGAIKLGSGDSEPFLGRDIGQGRDYSEEIAAVVDEEVSRLIGTAHQEAFDILTANRDVLDDLVRALFEKETLDRAEVAAVFQSLKLWPKRPAWTGSDSRVPSELPPVTPPPSLNGQNGQHGQNGHSLNGHGQPPTDGGTRRWCAVATRSAGKSAAAARPAARRRQPAASRARLPVSADPVGLARAAVASVDQLRIAAAVREILFAVGEDPDRDGLQSTPERVARAYAEMYQGLHQDPADVLATTFDLGHDELVLVKDIEVWSSCEHHLLPFTGVAHVGYLPSREGRITGLSKLARLVDIYAKRPQVQERLTTQIADAMEAYLAPRGVIVVIECEHLCMTMRGVRKPGSKTVTSAVRGHLRNNPATRAEAMNLIRG